VTQALGPPGISIMFDLADRGLLAPAPALSCSGLGRSQVDRSVRNVPRIRPNYAARGTSRANAKSSCLILPYRAGPERQRIGFPADNLANAKRQRVCGVVCQIKSALLRERFDTSIGKPLATRVYETVEFCPRYGLGLELADPDRARPDPDSRRIDSSPCAEPLDRPPPSPLGAMSCPLSNRHHPKRIENIK
jgi:hypothetical protein